MTVPANCREAFDYARMAREARREQEVLRARLAQRRAAGPAGPDQELVWKRENSVLYAMYLEQRCSAQLLERRAQRQAEGALGA